MGKQVTHLPRFWTIGQHCTFEMPRIARFVAEGIPHHVTQRGNHREPIFDDAEDRAVYLRLLRYHAEAQGLRIWAWCLMTNHIHLLAVPDSTVALPRAIGYAHRDYARYRNIRRLTAGHLWQARYYSCAVDSPGICPVMAYIERNPVRAGLVQRAEEYPWSSARAHILGQDDTGFLDTSYWAGLYSPNRWRDVLRIGIDAEALEERFRLATRTGRPFGSKEFVAGLEENSGRRLWNGKPGRPKNGN